MLKLELFWVLQEDVEDCQMISIVFTSRDKLPFFSEVKKGIVVSMSQIYYGL